jgi:hypothetical protein
MGTKIEDIPQEVKELFSVLTSNVDGTTIRPMPCCIEFVGIITWKKAIANLNATTIGPLVWRVGGWLIIKIIPNFLNCGRWRTSEDESPTTWI